MFAKIKFLQKYLLSLADFHNKKTAVPLGATQFVGLNRFSRFNVCWIKQSTRQIRQVQKWKMKHPVNKGLAELPGVAQLLLVTPAVYTFLVSQIMILAVPWVARGILKNLYFQPMSPLGNHGFPQKNKANLVNPFGQLQQALTKWLKMSIWPKPKEMVENVHLA